MQFRRHSWAGRALTALLVQTAAVSAAAPLALLSPWDASQWVASDDSVRPGGRSQSHLEILPADGEGKTTARFYGTLDYEALNGSGFASQRTTDAWPGADLSAYDRLYLTLPAADGKTYSLNLKDALPPTVDGVEQPTVSWEFDFPTARDGQVLQVLFADLVPTYLGRVQNDTEPLNLASIKRMSIMIRSFFGQEEQAGDFELRIKSIMAADATAISSSSFK